MCQRFVCVCSQDQVKDIIYKGSQEQILKAVRPDGKVPLVCPPVCLSAYLIGSELPDCERNPMFFILCSAVLCNVTH